MKEADCAERDTGAEQLCVEYFAVWFGFCWLLEKAALPTVTTQHVTHTYNSTEGATNKTRTTWRELNVIQKTKQLKTVTLPRAGKDLIVPRGLMV